MKPAFRIIVGGSDITGTIGDRLLSLTVSDAAGVKSDSVDIELDDRDSRLAIPPTKATVSVAIGYEGNLVDKGTYVVEEIGFDAPPRKMTIRANAVGASKGAGAAREESYHETTLGDIASTIAKRRGWQSAISSELASIEIEHADQTENDMAFISRIASENGAVAKVQAGRLIITKHASGKSVSGQTLPTVVIDSSKVTSWGMTMAERGNYEGVKAQWRDKANGKTVDLIVGKDGENTQRLPHTFGTKEEALAAAKARKSSLDRGKAKLSLTMPGDPNLEADARLIAVGFRAGVDGEWTVINVTHNLTSGSYTCNVECETPEGSEKAKADGSEDESEGDDSE